MKSGNIFASSIKSYRSLSDFNPKMSSIQVTIIEDQKSLIKLGDRLSSVNEFSFDTEYDSFKRTYGFKMLLMQIYVDEQVYIIDPLQLQDLSPLWPAFENLQICKVVYSGSEDIALLKQLGCGIRNIFDVQVAATLCNHTARNLGDLIELETGQPADKGQQTSDWHKRPLTPEQLLYAANDVIFLPQLKKTLFEGVVSRDLVYVLDEENAALEHIKEREHIPRLKPLHYKENSQSYCDALLAMIMLRDSIARELNRPPVQVVDTRYLEEALAHRDHFLSQRDFKGFHPKIRNTKSTADKFIRIVEHFDPQDKTRARRPHDGPPPSRRPQVDKEERIAFIARYYEPVKQDFIEKYGERAAEFLLRGLKKLIATGNTEGQDLKPYQQEYLAAIVGSQSNGN